MRKLVISILLIFLNLPVIPQSNYTNIELIKLVEQTVSNSLLRVEIMGKLGDETINGLISGTLEYSTELTGFNKVNNTITFKNYQDDFIKLSGKLVNEVNWFGTGTAISEYMITEPQEYYIQMKIQLKQRNPIGGSCFITKKGSSPIEYSFEVLEENKL